MGHSVNLRPKKMKGMAILRSHGGRYQAIQDGEVQIDIAVIAAPSADMFGNANGVDGPAACGLLGFALGDSQYADQKVIVGKLTNLGTFSPVFQLGKNSHGQIYWLGLTVKLVGLGPKRLGHSPGEKRIPFFLGATKPKKFHPKKRFPRNPGVPLN